MDYIAHIMPSLRASLPHAAMIRTPPRYPASHRVNITTCALCGRRRSRRYRLSPDPEPLVCSKCVATNAPPNVVIELLIHGDENARTKRDAPQVIEVLPTETSPKPTELPADEQGRPFSRRRGYSRLSPIDEEPPAVDRNTKPRSYRRP